MTKICDLIEEKQSKGQEFISYEFFPPKTEKGVENLRKRIDKFQETNPLFVDYTWGAGGSTADLTLDLTIEAKKKGLEPNMHLTCTNMDVSLVDSALEKCVQHGIQNIVALRGDPPVGKEEWVQSEGGFSCALDLVKHIRKVYGDYFCISVAGYPEGHPNKIRKIDSAEENQLSEDEQARKVVMDDGVFVCRDEDFREELKYLKEKVDAGADLILTQMFFDVQTFKIFVRKCREIGITCPIVPGIMLIQAYGGFTRMTAFCKSRVPSELREALEALKDDDKAVKEFGIKRGIQLCKDLLESKLIPGLHFYTLNQDHVVNGICEGLVHDSLAK